LSRPRDLEELRTVLHHQGNVITGTETGVPQQMGQPVGAFVEIPVRGDQSRSGHDDGRAIGMLVGLKAQVALVGHRIASLGLRPTDCG
jgi:hypothetical protein